MRNKARFPLLFVILFVSFGLSVAVFKMTDPNLKFNKLSYPTPIQETTSSLPINILIPKINKSLKIAPARVVGNVWQLYDDKVAWLATSSTPGNGNVILYAHDRRNLFGDLYKLGIGDKIRVQTANGWSDYKVRETKKISPTDINAVLSNQNQLTLYTCDGTFDQKRLVVYADLDGQGK